MAQQIKKKYIANDAVDGDKLKLMEGQAVRALDSEDQIVELLKLGASDEVLAKGQEIAFKADLTQEVSDREAAVAAEVSDRAAADTSIRADLTQEASDRAAGDANLQDQIDNILSNVDPAALDSLTEIVAAFQAADGSLNSAISTLAGAAGADLTAEISAREAADTSIRADLTQEVSDREAAVSAEASLRAAADTSIRADLTQEVSDREAAVFAEESARIAEDATMFKKDGSRDLSGNLVPDTAMSRDIGSAVKPFANVNAGQLNVGIISGPMDNVAFDSKKISFLAAGTDSTDAVNKGQLDAAVANASGDVSAEASIRAAADTSIRADLTQEVSDREAAVAAEASIRAAADTSIRADLTQEASDRAAGDANLQDQIDNILSNVDPAALDSLTEIVAAFQAADGSLNSAISTLAGAAGADLTAEASLRAAADTSIRADLTQEVSDREAAVFAEESARIAEDATLVKLDGSRAMMGSLVAGVMANPFTGAGVDIGDSIGGMFRAAYVGVVNTLKLDSPMGYFDMSSGKLSNVANGTDSGDAVNKGQLDSVESALDARLDAMEAVAWYSYKKELDATDISNGYVDLPHDAAVGSMVGFVDRLAIHQGAGEDYTTSVVGGVTRVTFVNALVGAGASALVAGDNVYFKYQK